MVVFTLGASIATGRSADAGLTVTVDDGSGSTALTITGATTGVTYYISADESGHGHNATYTTTSSTLASIPSHDYDYAITFTTLKDVSAGGSDQLWVTATVATSSSGITHAPDNNLVITLSDAFGPLANPSTLSDTVAFSGFTDSGHDGDDSLSGKGQVSNPSKSVTESVADLDPSSQFHMSGYGSPSGGYSATADPATSSVTTVPTYTLTNTLTLNLGGDSGDVITATNNVSLADTPTATPEPTTIAMALSGLGTMGIVHLLRRRRSAKASH